MCLMNLYKNNHSLPETKSRVSCYDLKNIIYTPKKDMILTDILVFFFIEQCRMNNVLN